MNEPSHDPIDPKKAKFEKWGPAAFSIHVAKIYAKINGHTAYSCHDYLVRLAFAEASRLKAQDTSGSDFSPSLFKRLGFLTVQLLRDEVFTTPFRKGHTEAVDRIADNSRHVASYLILLYAINCMEDSVIASFPESPRRKIFLSNHSFYDIVEALSKIRGEKNSYRIISSLYEQIFYKTNPESQYDFREDYPLIVDPIKPPPPKTN